MPRRRSTPIPAPTPRPLQPGQAEKIVTRLYLLPRETRYQGLCVRLGQLILDLPVSHFHAWYRGPETRVRHCPAILRDSTLEEWVIEVLRENLLAGVVLTDALEYVTRLIWMMRDGEAEVFPETQTKRRLTEVAGEYAIEFEVPPGWEFILQDTTHPAGFVGIARVRRCHLSQTFYQGEHGYGRLVGGESQGLEQAAGFDIPCDYFPKLRVEGAVLASAQSMGSFGIGLQVPYAFVRRAFRIPWRENEPLTFIPRPSEDELIALARAAVERLVDRAEARPRPGQGGVLPTEEASS